MLSDLSAEPVNEPGTWPPGETGKQRQPRPAWRGRPAARLIAAAFIAYGAAGLVAEGRFTVYGGGSVVSGGGFVASSGGFVVPGVMAIGYGAIVLAVRSYVPTGLWLFLSGAIAVVLAYLAFFFDDVLMGAVGVAFGIALIAYGRQSSAPAPSPPAPGKW